MSCDNIVTRPGAYLKTFKASYHDVLKARKNCTEKYARVGVHPLDV